MAIARVASSSPLVQRSCLRCGYRGEEIQRRGERAAYRCPDCGQDLYARPPRSYAEMEGLLVDVPDPTPPPSLPIRPPAQRPLPRRGWLPRLLAAILSPFGRSTRPAAAVPPGVNARQPQGPSSLSR